MKRFRWQGAIWLAAFLFTLAAAASAFAAEAPPYEFDAALSLTGGCGTTKADPIPDPGCPEQKPPKPFSKPLAIASDSYGDEFVASYSTTGTEGRVDVFSAKGIFITEISTSHGPKGLAVDSKGNLYVFEQTPGSNSEISRYAPSVYKPAEEKIEYGNPRKVVATNSVINNGGIAVDASDDHLYIDVNNAILEYSSAEAGNELLETITDERLKTSNFVAVDAQRRRLYASACPDGDVTKCWVLVFDADAPHELLEEVTGADTPEERFRSGKGWISIAVDEETGDFFVGDLELSSNVFQFDEDYELVSTLKISSSLFEGGEPLQIAISNAKAALNHHYLFVPSLKNRALAFSPPKCQSPVVEELLATGIAGNEAELQALIKPRGCTTTYRIEYLTQQAYEEAGNNFTGAQVVGEGTIQPAEQEVEVKAAISGLEPETAYRFRAVAENESGEDEEEATFTTYNDASIATDCPEAVRNTYSTLLPDCRAYELVTPADTNGRPPHGIEQGGDLFSTIEVSPSGSTLSFLTSGGVLPGTEGAGGLNGDQYQVTRGSAGWNTQSVSPSGSQATLPIPGSTSLDQGYAFWVADGEGPAVIGSFETHYVRYPDGHLELVGRGSEGIDPRATGKFIAPNGTHILFQTRVVSGNQPVQLEPDAPPTGTAAVYDRTADEVTHVVSLLPGNQTPKAGENASYVGASPGGEGIAFELKETLYLRVNNATTYEIGKGVEFAGISEEGRRIFYVEGGDLFAFDTALEEAIPFTEVGNAIPVNVSSDGTRAYFVSTTAIEGSSENPDGSSAEAGKENLYLSEEGQIRFVATVTTKDVEGEINASSAQVNGLGLWSKGAVNRQPAIDPSRTNPDGTVLLFSSRADLDGYAHEGVPELYRYDSIGNRLHCISCDPTRTSATEGASLESFITAAEGAPPFGAYGFVPNLRADGKRVVFQSTEALVSADNDEVQDVYEWEEGGVGSCTRIGGCVYLISSGHSAKNNYIYGVGESADDIFFTTTDILVGGDNNTLSIYDARVNGGFPEVTEEPCEGEGCRPDLSIPPSVVKPESGVRSQSGNVEPSKTKKHCPKGKRKVKRHGKVVCVKKHHRRHHEKGAGK